MACCRVLIVEDDPLISQHLEAIVTQTLGSDVVVSTSVAEAREALANVVDFALLDVDVLDGKTYAFASQLNSAEIPFAFVSASDRKHVPVALRDVPFVAKPYSNEDIVGLLQAAGKGASPIA